MPLSNTFFRQHVVRKQQNISPNIGTTLDINPMSILCLASGVEGGPTSNRHWVNILGCPPNAVGDVRIGDVLIKNTRGRNKGGGVINLGGRPYGALNLPTGE